MTIGRLRRVSSSAALSTSLALAVAVMHVLVVGCLAGGSMPADDHASSPMMSAATTVGDHIAAATPDCAMSGHACTFVRADAIALVVAVGLVVALAPLRTAIAARLVRRTVLLGRPPPWAVLGHLQLSVIRR